LFLFEALRFIPERFATLAPTLSPGFGARLNIIHAWHEHCSDMGAIATNIQVSRRQSLDAIDNVRKSSQQERHRTTMAMPRGKP